MNGWLEPRRTSTMQASPTCHRSHAATRASRLRTDLCFPRIVLDMSSGESMLVSTSNRTVASWTRQVLCIRASVQYYYCPGATKLVVDLLSWGMSGLMKAPFPPLTPDLTPRSQAPRQKRLCLEAGTMDGTVRALRLGEQLPLSPTVPDAIR